MLVPILLNRNCQLLLSGRDPAALKSAFLKAEVCSLADLPEAASGYDALLHLSALNTDSGADYDEMKKVNVEFAVDIALLAKNAGIPNFLYASSIHALDESNQTHYAVSKRQAAAALANLSGINCHVFYLATVYGKVFCGGLSRLNALPAAVRKIIFPFFAALKPTLHINLLADAVLKLAAPNSMAYRFDEIVLTDGQNNNKVYAFFIRAIDLAFALTVLVAFSWLLLIIAIIIRFTSLGPILHIHKRVGRSGKPFSCYKFRTMKAGTSERPTHDTNADSVTDFGRMLRRTKLDELPQALNILRGQMSLIGPRPSLRQQEALIAERQRLGVLDVRPGITGYAQVKGIDMRDAFILAKTDARFLALRCLWLDCQIIVATLSGRGFGDNVKSQRQKS